MVWKRILTLPCHYTQSLITYEDMGRHVARSRGCQICIKRRIKCDETAPECNECISSGRKCDGPLKGTLFLDVSLRIRQAVENPTKSGTKKKKRPTVPVVLYGTANNEKTPSTLVEGSIKSVACSSDAYKLPTSYQPRKGDIFQQHYISHYISSQETCIHSWLVHIPDFISTSIYSPEVFAIRATTMAFYGKMSGNEDIQHEATRWYSRGLESQRTHLEETSKEKQHGLCTKRAVCAAILFSHFETILSTNPMGWIHHYNAASKLLELSGPEQCQRGLPHMFFRTIRVASFITSLTADEPSPFASTSWCTLPFQENPKDVFDLLVDILLQLPSCLPCRNEMRRLRDEDPIRSEMLRYDLDTNAQHNLKQLTTFWDEQKQHYDPHYDRRIEEIISLIREDESAQQSLSSTLPFISSFAAYLTSMYDSGNIITLRCLAAASLCPDAYTWQIILHGASILASVAYHEIQGAINTGSFSMTFPVKLICLLSPSEVQRDIARDTLQRWGSRRGLVNSCQVAPSYLDRSHG